MYIAILGRQPAISMAELECYFGTSMVRWHSDVAALINSSKLNIDSLGGSQKAGRVILEARGNWLAISRKIIQHYTTKWHDSPHKITLGISAYGFEVQPRDVQKTGIILKQKLRTNGVGLRLIPNTSVALNTATSHHNKLGLSPNKVELLVVRGSNGQAIIAESVGAQNITALAARDQARPRTDTFVGMLPPKLARIMINLAGLRPETTPTPLVPPLILDPFCGTGTVLQEALLSGYRVAGSDLSQKMVDYSRDNLTWLAQAYQPTTSHRDNIAISPTGVVSNIINVNQADATSHHWTYHRDIAAIVCEAYLGQPFSAPPSPAKLAEVRDNCNHIISTFLHNIQPQLTPGTPLVVAVPAWCDHGGHLTHLPLIKRLNMLGYRRRHLSHVRDEQLVYYREGQVVSRELLLLEA